MANVAGSKRNERAEFLYLGGSGSVEEALAGRVGLPFRAISAGGLRGQRPWTMAWNGLKLMIGLRQALSAVADFRPDAILATGGYMSVPVVLAGRLRRVPVLMYLPDIVPGLAIRRLSRWASRVAVSFSEAVQFFEAGKAVLTGYPVRREFFELDRTSARSRLELEMDGHVVVVFGGSRGARSINLAVARVLQELLQETLVIHVCGDIDIAEALSNREGLPPRLREKYRPVAYLHEEMPPALAAADLVVARAGASTLGEFPALGLPSILVPYPYSGQHQDANAEFMVSHGAAISIRDADLQEDLLVSISGLLNDEEKLARMSRNARGLSRPEAAHQIAEELRTLATASPW